MFTSEECFIKLPDGSREDHSGWPIDEAILAVYPAENVQEAKKVFLNDYFEIMIKHHFVGDINIYEVNSVGTIDLDEFGDDMMVKIREHKIKKLLHEFNP